MRLIILLLFCAIEAMAQNHIKNQVFFEGNYGKYDLVKNSNMYSLKMGKYNRKLNSSQIGFVYKTKNAPAILGEITELNSTVPVSQFFIDYTAEFVLAKSYNNTAFFKFTTGAILGYESINKEKRTINELIVKTSSDYIFGPKLGIELELHGLTLGISEHISLFSNYTKFSTVPYVGYRLHFKY